MDMPRKESNADDADNWQVNGNNFTNTPLGMGNSMVDSFIWDQPINGGAMFFPPNLPHFPSNSGFIERAARFSCFSGGNFGEIMNPLSVLDNSNPYSRALGTENSPLKNEKKIDNFMRDEAKRGVNVSGNESNDAQFSGRGEEESSGTQSGSKKRKRNKKTSVEVVNVDAEITQKGDQNSPISKTNGKNCKFSGCQGSDLPKEDYIHIRAQRGQATNRHSLAERVRREKISERMKYLQDIVPGCSKVTGKAVMLDEIINYVESLQRQVEFLSMKLATVNPGLDFNIEGLLAKDTLQPRAVLSSSLAFPPNMTLPFPQMYLSQPGVNRAIDLQSNALVGGFNESTNQVPNVWDDELHNVIHMGFGSNASLNSQDLSGSLLPGHMKTEP